MTVRAVRVAGVVGLLSGLAVGAGAQASNSPSGPSWSYSLDVGGFVQGNGKAITHWLSHNAYGATEPKRCTFDVLFRPICDSPMGYPKTTESSSFAAMGSVRRNVSPRTALELFVSMEQSGTVTGRCDDLASPKDPRCTDRFMQIRFGGASFSLLGEVTQGWLHLGAGPALLLANWDMSPAHLAGVWVDATLERDPIPVFLRGQYRYYGATTLEPSKGFSRFHPSSLFLGLGLRTRANNGGA